MRRAALVALLVGGLVMATAPMLVVSCAQRVGLLVPERR